MLLSKSLARLIGELERLPGIGPKSAQRLAFHILRLPVEEVEKLSAALVDARKKIRFCSQCFHLTDEDLCEICRDVKRDSKLLCIVAEARDVIAMERTGEFRGLYHVLHGLISPIDGIGPEQLHVSELLTRISANEINEVIMATNPTIEGDATALYLAKLLKPFVTRITRIAYGMPVGGDLDYADQATLISAIQYRRDL